jgi:hypothetical protein
MMPADIAQLLRRKSRSIGEYQSGSCWHNSTLDAGSNFAPAEFGIHRVNRKLAPKYGETADHAGGAYRWIWAVPRSLISVGTEQLQQNRDPFVRSQHLISDDEADSVPSSGREKTVRGDNGNQKPSRSAAFDKVASEWKSQQGPAGMMDEHKNSLVLPARERPPDDCKQRSTIVCSACHPT